MTGIAVLSVALGLVVLTSIVASLFGPVSRSRVETFARQQWLLITPDNGNGVIRYLRTTRRWRAGMLLVSLVAFAWWPVATRHGGSVSFLGAFVGWFVGAVVAEWRVDHLARGPQAAAVLRPRLLLDYVSRRAVALPLAVWTASAALGMTSLVATLQRSSGRVAAAGSLLVMTLAAAAIVAVIRGILERPQPLAAHDLLAADNAIRGRSLHVMLGSAVAIGGYLVVVSTQLLFGDGDLVGWARFAGYLVLPLLGGLVARWSQPASVARARQRVTA